jgi:hypothetical protein
MAVRARAGGQTDTKTIKTVGTEQIPSRRKIRFWCIHRISSADIDFFYKVPYCLNISIENAYSPSLLLAVAGGYDRS